MAKVTLNPMFKDVHGRLGNFVFRRSHTGGTTLIRLADMSKVTWSEAQKAHRQRFKEAVAYARAAMIKPGTRVHYEQEALRLGKRPFDLAVSDYFKDRNLLKE